MSATPSPKGCGSRRDWASTARRSSSLNLVQETTTYTVFLKFSKEILATSTQADEAQLLLDANPDLDYLYVSVPGV